MKVIKEADGNVLKVKVEGRVDTTTAPKFQQEIEDALDGITELIFDLAKMEYISSAGLRVFLSVHKRMTKQGSMLLKNVTETVMEIFDITGFSDILNIE